MIVSVCEFFADKMSVRKAHILVDTTRLCPTIYCLVHTWFFPVHTMPSVNAALVPTGRLLAVTIVGVAMPRANI